VGATSQKRGFQTGSVKVIVDMRVCHKCANHEKELLAADAAKMLIGTIANSRY
jgi:hypothetical protein